MKGPYLRGFKNKFLIKIMKIGSIIKNFWWILFNFDKTNSQIDQDGKYWIQHILLKKYLKSLNKIN